MDVNPRAIYAAMEYPSAMTIEEIAKEEGVDRTVAAERFPSSRTAEMLFDDAQASSVRTPSLK